KEGVFRSCEANIDCATPSRDCATSSDDCTPKADCRKCFKIFGASTCINDPACESNKSVQKAQCELEKEKAKAKCESQRSLTTAACEARKMEVVNQCKALQSQEQAKASGYVEVFSQKPHIESLAWRVPAELARRLDQLLGIQVVSGLKFYRTAPSSMWSRII